MPKSSVTLRVPSTNQRSLRTKIYQPLLIKIKTWNSWVSTRTTENHNMGFRKVMGVIFLRYLLVYFAFLIRWSLVAYSTVVLLVQEKRKQLPQYLGRSIWCNGNNVCQTISFSSYAYKKTIPSFHTLISKMEPVKNTNSSPHHCIPIKCPWNLSHTVFSLHIVRYEKCWGCRGTWELES